MENWFYATPPVIVKMLLTCAFIFISIVTIARVAGLRTFAKMSSVDFASTIAIGSILASTIMNNQQSLLKGALAMAAITLLQILFAWLKKKSPGFSKIAVNTPMLLMKGGEIYYDNLKAANLDESELTAKLREANVLHLSEVHAVVLETTGDISVLHGKENKRIDDMLLKNVRTV